MRLLIDCGNRNIVFALWQGEAPRALWRKATDPRATADEYAIWLASAFAAEGLSRQDVEGVAVASVVPALDWAFAVLAREHFGCEPFAVRDAVAAGAIEVRLDAGASAGDDRLANAAGAAARYGGPLVVVDFGTATTFDCVAADGAYEGGVIAPGVDLSLEALHRGTARLPRAWFAKPEGPVVGRNSMAALASGVYWGYAAMVEGLLARIRAEHPFERAVATGGQAELLLPELPSVEHADPTLTLYGLHLLAERTQAGRSAKR